jgi:dienelactone hydrolase
LKQRIGWTFVALAVLLLAVVVGSPYLPRPFSELHPKSRLLAKAHAKTVTTTTSMSVVTATLPAQATPSASLTSAATPAASAADGTPSASPAPSPTPLLTREPNGISIGCLPGPPNQYLTCLAKEPEGFSMTFYLYLPKGYNPKTKYPLVLLLHGGGEVSEPTKTAEQNKETLITDPYAEVWGPGFPFPDSTNVQGNWPSFIVIPQVAAPNRFVDVPADQASYTLAPQPNDTMRMTKEIVDTVRLMYHDIDANRLYLTGLSMGGFGTWEMIERWPTYFAAAAPISGAGDPSKAALLVNLPIWAFHGALDTAVPVSASRDMITAIRVAGGNPRYTEYADQGHGVWEIPYTILGKPSQTPDFFSWLYAQHK